MRPVKEEAFANETADYPSSGTVNENGDGMREGRFKILAVLIVNCVLAFNFYFQRSGPNGRWKSVTRSSITRLSWHRRCLLFRIRLVFNL